jgi:hypothetical protein
MAKLGLSGTCFYARCNRNVGPTAFWCSEGHRFCSAECRVAYQVTKKRTEKAIGLIERLVSRWLSRRARIIRRGYQPHRYYMKGFGPKNVSKLIRAR